MRAPGAEPRSLDGAAWTRQGDPMAGERTHPILPRCDLAGARAEATRVALTDEDAVRVDDLVHAREPAR